MDLTNVGGSELRNRKLIAGGDEFACGEVNLGTVLPLYPVWAVPSRWLINWVLRYEVYAFLFKIVTSSADSTTQPEQNASEYPGGAR